MRVCRWHGGHTDRAKVERFRLERELHKHLPPQDQWPRLDPLEAADLYRAEAHVWLDACRRMVEKLDSFEATTLIDLGDGKRIEKIGAEVRAIVVVYQAALDRSFRMATEAVKLGLAQRYSDQLERNAEAFARVLAVGAQMLAVDYQIPVEQYARVIPLAIETVQREAAQ